MISVGPFASPLRRARGVNGMFSIKNGTLRHNQAEAEQIPSPYVGGRFAKAPKIVVMHFTGGSSGRSSAEWFRSPQNVGSSAHVVIDRDGSVIQCVSFTKVAWHAGRSRWGNLIGLNQHSIGIELANWGNLKSAGDGWASSTGRRIDQPSVGNHRNGNPNGERGPIGWEPYTEEQIASAAAITRALISAYSVNEIVGHDDIARNRKWDPGPAFDMARFRTACLGGRQDDGDNLVRVVPAAGLNLRSGPGVSFPSIQLLPSNSKLEPIAAEGRWIEVNANGAGGATSATGWVHSAFVVDD